MHSAAVHDTIRSSRHDWVAEKIGGQETNDKAVRTSVTSPISMTIFPACSPNKAPLTLVLCVLDMTIHPKPSSQSHNKWFIYNLRSVVVVVIAGPDDDVYNSHNQQQKTCWITKQQVLRKCNWYFGTHQKKKYFYGRVKVIASRAMPTHPPNIPQQERLRSPGLCN